jgi:hypothetical protein
MAAKPWLDSDDIVSAVKRKITMPTFQSTFTEADILAFANEEMAVSQVPSVLSFHEEYFVTTKLEGGSESVPLEDNKSRYPVPSRAIGLRLRDLFYSDGTNLFEMIRISPDDKSYFEGSGITTNIRKFYIEGNDVVLVPNLSSGIIGSLVMPYYLRPNQLVATDRAATITAFSKTITVNNTGLLAGDTVIIQGITFTAVAAGAVAFQFNIGATSTDTATNLAASITAAGTATATSAVAIVTCSFTTRDITITTSNSSSFSIQSGIGLVCDEIPSDFSVGSKVDFLQTKPGHKSLALSITIPTGGISGTTLNFSEDFVPDEMILGDYVCLEHECIIPQIPSDLHINLVERTCARILAAIGDQAGLEATNNKLAEIEVRQGTLLDNRVEGAPQKVLSRNSLLRYGKINFYRRF